MLVSSFLRWPWMCSHIHRGFQGSSYIRKCSLLCLCASQELFCSSPTPPSLFCSWVGEYSHWFDQCDGAQWLTFSGGLRVKRKVSNDWLVMSQFKTFCLQFAVLENIHTHPTKDNWKFLGEGVLKTKNWQEKCEANLEFPTWCWGVQIKKTFHEENVSQSRWVPGAEKTGYILKYLSTPTQNVLSACFL